jgi:hypothetical protein
MAVLPKRLARFGLTLHPTPTTLMAFRPPEAHAGSDSGNGTCDFFGVTHSWTQSRQGFWVSNRRTARKRLRRTKKSLWRWCRTQRHAPLPSPYQMLCAQLRGPVQYYGMRGTCRRLEAVRRFAEHAWRSWLSRRRSKKAMGWEKCAKRMQPSILPIPRLGHPIGWAMQGSTVMRQSSAEALVTAEPSAFIAHVRVCGSCAKQTWRDPVACKSHLTKA